RMSVGLLDLPPVRRERLRLLMTPLQILDTHPFAAGMAAGVALTFFTLMLCAVFLYSLEKTKAMARESARAASNHSNPLRQTTHGVLSQSAASPDSCSVS